MHEIMIEWPAEANEQGRPMRWFGSWLVGGQGGEGRWFYSGTGGGAESYVVPVEATGVRIRRWPSDGLDAEYADILNVPPAMRVSADALDFDVRQPFSLLPEEFH